MEWWELLLVIFSALGGLIAIGMPVAFAFLLVNLGAIFVLQGGGRAFHSLILSMYDSVSSFTLLPIALFVLMGEILWHSNLAFKALDVLDKLLGRLTGRLSILTVITGTLFSSLSGSTMANTALLGTMLLPEMERRGYKKPMSIGPILGSGGLAMMIPPSSLAVILAAIGKISIGKLLVGALIPGLIMAVLYLSYIIIRCRMQPHLTPAYDVTPVSLREKLIGVFKYLMPLGIIVFLVTGVIIIGVATPTEAAALGCFGSIVMAAVYGGLTFVSLKKAVMGTVQISVMMMTILASALTFSQLLAYSGASRGMLEYALTLAIEPIILVLVMQLVVLILGMFMEQVAIMLIMLPIYIPVINALGLDPVWYGVLMLMNLQMALTTPPFGMLLFVMKGVAPQGTTMRQIYMAGMPFLVCDAVALTVVLLVPATVTYLPGLFY
ncbi:MAG: tripartite transporter large subunit [marine bacterium B5-7]|nr:MAG: tripartite transporter large subunit [marine bacterium B5-7]